MALYPRGYYPLRAFYQRNAPVIQYRRKTWRTRHNITLSYLALMGALAAITLIFTILTFTN